MYPDGVLSVWKLKDALAPHFPAPLALRSRAANLKDVDIPRWPVFALRRTMEGVLAVE